MRRMGMILDFSASASSIITITGQSVQDAASTEITSILPDWDCDVDIVGNIFDLGAITAGESYGHEFQVVTSKKFKKLKKNQERKAVKEAARAAKLRQQDCHAATLSHSLSITKSVCLAVCLLATAGLGDGCPISSLDYTSTTVEDPQINGVFAQDKNFANINATYIGEPESESSTKRSIFDPFLSCPSYIMEKVNKLRADCADVWRQFKARTYGCFSGMPHEKDIKRKHEIPMKIELKEEFIGKDPPPARTYRTPYHLLQVLKKSLVEMLKAGWIRPSTSEYCAPVLVLVKPHQDVKTLAPADIKYRVCIDLSDVNLRTKTLHYRVPDVTSAWDKLSKCKFFSVLDLEKGFWQSKICPDDDSISRTAFGCEFGHYEFVTAPMGAKNSPAHFQSNIEAMLKRNGLMDMGCLRFTGPETIRLINGTPCVHTHIDDLIVYSKTKDQHLEDLHRVCSALSDEQYYCNRDKCFFFCEYVKYVGGIVGNDLLAMDPEKVESIDLWEQPTTTTELRGFLGMCNFLRRWYQHYAEDSKVLNRLLKKGAQVVRDWDSTHTFAFNRIKDAFKTNPILRLPDFDKPFVLHTDSCDHSIGGALLQAHDGHLLPVAYHSRSMNDAEFKYPVRDQEGLALVDCFKKFTHYLRGAQFTVICKTDHQSLKYLNNGKPLEGRLGRWQEYLNGYDYEIIPIQGVKNLVADGISRSITMHTAKNTVVINTPASAIERLTNSTHVTLGAMFVVHDTRMEHLDYRRCKHFANIYDNLASNDIITDTTANPKYRYYSRVQNQLFYRMPDGSYPLCIPSKTKSTGGVSLRELLIKECHDSPYMGHRGALRTYIEMRPLFYWPGMRTMINKYVSSCVVCMRAKSSTLGECGRLKPNEVPRERMDSISMDLIVGLPDIDGYSMVAVIVDRLSKKIFCEPLKNTITALELATLLNKNIFLEHGVPLQIISDRDAKMTSAVWRSFFKIIGCELTMSYSYHQRFDGQTEVMNRVIEQILRCYINFNQDNWMELLPYVLSAINNSVNPGTLLSPNNIFYGRPIMRPINLLQRAHEALPDVRAYFEHQQDLIKLGQDYARTAMVAFTSRHFKGLSRTVDSRLQVGTKVMVDATNMIMPGHKDRPSKKLLSRRLGPLTIIKKMSDVSFRLNMPRPWRTHCDFHAKNLTHIPDHEFEIRSGPEPDYVNGDENYTVERIDARRYHYRKLQYFVVYHGYPVDEGQWRPATELLQTCADKVRAYDSKHGPAPLVKTLHADPISLDLSTR